LESKHNFINLNGVNLAYKWINTRAKNNTVIIFLHEGLGSIEQWKDYPEKLCKQTGHKGLIYERQGYGSSSPLNGKRDINYLHNYALKELPALIEALEIKDDIILYGHSDGGSIALIYTSVFPDQIKGIITEAAHVFVEDITLKGIEPVVKEFEHKGLNEKLEKYHGEKTREIFYAWADTWRTPPFINWNIEAELKDIFCPVLAIQGADDEFGTPLQLDSIADNCSGFTEKILLPDCRHIPHKQQTESVFRTASFFIRNIVA